MSIEINSVIIGGNLTRDVVLKEIGTGRAVASFTVATNRTYITNGEKKQETAFVDVDVWGGMAQNCAQYLRKGSPVVVTGRIKQDQWQASDGSNRSKLKILAGNVQFLSSGAKDNNEPQYDEPEGWQE